MKYSLISIYITNFNYGKFLEKSITSVLSQTINNYELIIIDDGSTDNSEHILEKYKKHQNIKIIFQKNIGLNASNNVALKLSKGKYILRLDADDFLEENALEEMCKTLDQDSDIAMVFPDYYLIDEDENLTGQFVRHDFENDVKLFDQPAHGACTMIRTDVLKSIGGYDEEFNRQDGYDIWLKITRTHKVKNINKPLFYYRQHDNSLSKDEFELLKTRAKIKAKYVETLKINEKKSIAIIPVRGTEYHSSPIHFAKLGNLKVIDWTILAALESKNIGDIIVSTNDEAIKNYVLNKYENKVKVFSRSKESYLENKSAELAVIETIEKYKEASAHPDYTLVLFLNYPFRSAMYIDKAINTMKLYNVDAVDSIRPDDSLIYTHNGKGLQLLKQDQILKKERDEFYKRCGGLHLLNTKNFLIKKTFFSGEVGHIIIDQEAAIGIHSKLDLKIVELLASEKYIK